MFIFLLLVSTTAQGLILSGTPQSYAQYSKWYIAINSTLELEFRTRGEDGLLVYMDDGGYYDFLEIKLSGGGLRVRFNQGGGPELFSLGEGLADFNWHKVVEAKITIKK
ncbi:neurexin-3 [Eurytemora carolleeae]|uniref:neurexin-3 n=1 Tax=Eurytemora carolleeae TaxID=1294199 RepID=UPI000C77CEBC|nr:neurexin-3 [Eurytemora carolleeae]|eukprot:XP_023342724.1 neurexin-3-like [Eurytemora affinis]